MPDDTKHKDFGEYVFRVDNQKYTIEKRQVHSETISYVKTFVFINKRVGEHIVREQKINQFHSYWATFKEAHTVLTDMVETEVTRLTKKLDRLKVEAKKISLMKEPV